MFIFQLLKFLTFVLVFFSAVSEICGLQCHECFWSNNEDDYKKDQEAPKEEQNVDVKYPKVKHFFDPIVKGIPTQKDIETYCIKKTCDPGQWCMKFTLKSSQPTIITRMCVGNPQQRSGCYQQLIETKDLKDAYLIKEACLCNDHDSCNKASASVSQFSFLFPIVVTIFLFLHR